ncbi:MAG: peptidoglycan-binding protein [Clostridiales bacterium]|nr:peptidoglycan-binding protein [Clostridiales bacterium]
MSRNTGSAKAVLRWLRVPIITICAALAVALIALPILNNKERTSPEDQHAAVETAAPSHTEGIPVPTEDEPDFSGKVFRVGDVDNEVINIQTRLMALFYMASDEPCNVYNQSVANAVKLFQRTHYMSQTGEADEDLLELLFSPVAKEYVLEYGNVGEDVSTLQERLNELGYYDDKQNGYFGVATERALEEFQQINSLETDGKADFFTRELLFSPAALDSEGRPSEIDIFPTDPIDVTPEPYVTETPEITEAPTETPIPTETPVPTDTPEPTVVPTASPTPVPPPTATPTATPRPTPVPTATPTPTPRPTATPTPTPKPTATPKPTPVPTATPTPTPKPTRTPKPTATPTPVPSGAPTATPTPKPTRTPKPTATPKPTPVPTATPTPTPKPTATPKPTPKPTATPKPTPVPTATPTPTPKPTATPTPTPKPTPVPTATPTPTPKPTATPTPTPKPTATPTPKPTATPTPAPTATPTTDPGDPNKPTDTPAPTEVPTTGVEGFIAVLMAQLGKPYVLGGTGPDTFDCSGLVYYCLRQMGINIGRLSAAGYSVYNGWTKIVSEDDLQRGDLIFFYNDAHNYISHVGVFLGNGKYIHASSSNGMIIISNYNNWCHSHYAWGRRVFSE